MDDTTRMVKKALYVSVSSVVIAMVSVVVTVFEWQEVEKSRLAAEASAGEARRVGAKSATTVSRIAEAEQFVVRDAHGKLRGWFGVAETADKTVGGLHGGELPMMTLAQGHIAGLLLADESGRVEAAAISTNGAGAVLNILGESEQYAHITGGGVELINKKGHLVADFKSDPWSFLDLHDSNGKVVWSTPSTK